MSRKRKQYNAEFKARVAVEAVRGNKTISEISSHYEVHPNQVAKWKKQALENLPSLFERGRNGFGQDREELVERLYSQIGRLQTELAWLKKKCDLLA